LLLNDADVQKELAITAEQARKIQQACRAVRAQVLGKYRNYKAANAGDAAAKANEAMESVYTETEKSLAKVLTAEQFDRLKQIDRQQRGMRDAGSRKALQLLPDQIQKLDKIRTSLNNDARQAFKKLPLSRKARIDAWQDLRKKAVVNELEVLTADQRKVWQELTGDPFFLFKFDESNGIDPRFPFYVPPPPRPGLVFPIGNT
jgi:hypothetical protein